MASVVVFELASQLIIALCLIMSGDVEINPGPLDAECEQILSTVNNTTFEEDDWNIVIDECSSLDSKWEQVSGFLGLPYSLIASIRGNHPSDNCGCWNDALFQWIKQNYNTTRFGLPSWRTLLTAVAKLDRMLFKKLAEVHKITVHSVEGEFERNCNSVDTTVGIGTNIEDTEIKVAEASSMTQSSTKSNSGFATLDPDKLSKEGKELLHQKLYADSEDMMYKFQELFSATSKSLKTRNVSVTELTNHLGLLGSINPTYKDSGLPPLRHQLPRLANARTVDAAMSIIKDYCSFFNYRMLEHIIGELGAEQDKLNLAKYKEDFTKYGECHVFQDGQLEVGKLSEEGHANMIVTLDDSFNGCTVNHLRSFINNLRTTLKIPREVELRLCRIESGSIKLIFQLPHFVKDNIFPLSSNQEADLAVLGVVLLSCGNYQFTSSNIIKDLENMTENAIQDHGGMEYVNSKNIEHTNTKDDAEFTLKVEELDTLSTSTSTDSAIGLSRSILSIITDTTAKETQFSDDLEQDDVDIETEQTATTALNELHIASCRGDLEEVKRLTEEGLNPLLIDENGRNALHYAAEGGDVRVQKYFVEERGHNPMCKDDEGWTPLHYAAYYNHFELVQYLIDKQNVDPLCQTKAGDTPLHKACIGGDLYVVRYLVSKMNQLLPLQDVMDSRGIEEQTPIHIAALNGHVEIVKFFVKELKCNPNTATSLQGKTPLHNASQGGHLATAIFLIEQHDCNPSHLDKNDVTPLHMAAGKGHMNIIRYLIQEQNCDPMCASKTNNTPLHYAAMNGQLEVIRYLIEVVDCSPDARGWYNMTPQELAYNQGHQHAAEYLESICSPNFT